MNINSARGSAGRMHLHLPAYPSMLLFFPHEAMFEPWHNSYVTLGQESTPSTVKARHAAQKQMEQ